jgi:Cysteine rich repeat
MRSVRDVVALAAFIVTMGPAACPGVAQTPAQDVTAAIQEQLGDQVLNGCNTELARFCAEVTPDEGRLLACLYAHGDKLTTQCDYALYDAAARLERAIGAITYVASECRAELETHCAQVDVGEGRVAQCLKAHAGELSPGCNQALTEAGGEVRLGPPTIATTGRAGLTQIDAFEALSVRCCATRLARHPRRSEAAYVTGDVEHTYPLFVRGLP